jgi:hypothetical protein
MAPTNWKSKPEKTSTISSSPPDGLSKKKNGSTCARELTSGTSQNNHNATQPLTTKLWVYDYRNNIHKTLKQNRLNNGDFEEFIKLYKPDDIKKRKEIWDE